MELLLFWSKKIDFIVMGQLKNKVRLQIKNNKTFMMTKAKNTKSLLSKKVRKLKDCGDKTYEIFSTSRKKVFAMLTNIS